MPRVTNIKESVDSICKDVTRPFSHMEWLQTPKHCTTIPTSFNILSGISDMSDRDCSDLSVSGDRSGGK